MRRTSVLLVTLMPILLSSGTGVLAQAVTAQEVVDFARDVRPILAANCWACHGPDEAARQAELRLDSFAGATAERDGRKALEPGHPDRSELIARINSTDPDSVMPPPKSGHLLTAA